MRHVFCNFQTAKARRNCFGGLLIPGTLVCAVSSVLFFVFQVVKSPLFSMEPSGSKQLFLCVQDSSRSSPVNTFSLFLLVEPDGQPDIVS